MKKLLLLVFILTVLASRLFSAQAGKVQLAVAAPDPVVAGGEVTFQIIVVNVGSEKWPQDKYYVEAEIYDAEKKYLNKTSRIKGTISVDPGMTNLVYINFPVPSGYVGTYFYKFYLVYNEQRIIESDFNTFNVVPLPITVSQPSAFRLGGNAVMSYRNTSRYEGKDYTGNLNLNLVGQLMERAMLFNLYTFHTPKSTSTASGINHEIYTILFNYYGDNWSLGLGDVLPSFSNLSLYSAGMRGAVYEGGFNNVFASFIGARKEKAVEGTSSVDGTYERWLLGARAGVELPGSVTVGGSYVSSYDRKTSLVVAGPGVKPADNTVTGGTVKWVPQETIVVDVEYQTSNYNENIDVSTDTISDYAYRFGFKYNPQNFLFRTYYQETRPEFYAFGSPGATRDRQTIDFYTNYLMLRRLSISAGINRFQDNLASDPDKVTTTQNIYSGGVSYTTPGAWPNPSVSYTMNQAIGDPSTAQDNVTNSIAIGLTSRINPVNLGLTLQQSAFKDNNKVSDDLDTKTVGFSANSYFGSRLSVNIGTTLTNTKNLVKKINNQTPAYSMSMNVEILKDKLGSQIWGTFITRQNDAVNESDKVDQQDSTGNVELTWLISSDFTWSVGGSSTQTRDNLLDDNNVNETGMNTRLSYSF